MKWGSADKKDAQGAFAPPRRRPLAPGHGPRQPAILPPEPLKPSLRIALLVDPLTLKRMDSNHAPQLARELLGRGHAVRGFWAPPGTIPRAAPEPTVDGGTAPEAGPGLSGFEPDVIVAYDALSPAAWLGTWRGKRLDKPLVLVEEGVSPASPFPLGALSRLGELLWGRYVRKNSAAVAALDPVARDQALAEGFAPERVHMIRTGVDLAAFRPGLSSHLVSRHGIRGRILLHVGPLRERRGLDTLVQAFARTVGQRGDWSLVLAGEGPGRRRLRALVERLGVAGRVYWIGKPREEELPGLMGSSTLYAAPALGNEERGSAVRRALACGLPVLASDLPRLSYLVDDDACGLLAPPGDTGAWERILTRAAISPMARRRWAGRARELARDRFDWSSVAEDFEDLLYAALERGEAGARVRTADG